MSASPTGDLSGYVINSTCILSAGFLVYAQAFKSLKNLWFYGSGVRKTGMNNRHIHFILIFILSISLFLPFQAHGGDARINDVLITQNIEYIQIYAKVANAFTKDMESAILAGVPTTFTFLLDLYQERSLWLDKKVVSVVIKHTIKYDNIKKTFYVWHPGSQEPEGFQDLEAAKRAMAELNGVVVTSVKDLWKNTPTYLMIKAKLDKVRLPLGMEYVFIFVSLWDFETDWYKQRFIF